MASQQTRALAVLAPGVECKAQAGEQDEGDPQPEGQEPGQPAVGRARRCSDDPTGAGAI